MDRKQPQVPFEPGICQQARPKVSMPWNNNKIIRRTETVKTHWRNAKSRIFRTGHRMVKRKSRV